MENDYIQNGIDNAEFLCHLGISHTLRLSSGAARIEPEGGKPMVFASGDIPKKHLWFLRYVKNAVKKSQAFLDNKPLLEKLGSKDVPYILSQGFQNGKYTGIDEIDINGAYWAAAYHLGYIPEKVYLRGIETDENGQNKIPKSVRLIALGALARRRTVRKFTKETGYQMQPIDYNAQLGGVFFHCAMYIGNTMLKCVDAIFASDISRNPFCFFWFDAIFVDRRFSGLVEKFFNKHNFDSKRIEIQVIEITGLKTYRKAIAEFPDGSTKQYNLSLNFEVKKSFDEFISQVNRKHL